MAETKIVWPRYASHSSNLSGRLSVQDGRRKPYSARRRLARPVAAEHAAELRHRDVALVDDDQRVARHVFEKGRRRLAGFAAGQIARIVLDAGARAGRLDHFDIVLRALLEPLRFEQPALAVQFVEADLEVALDLLDRLQQRRARRHVMAVGVDLDRLQRGGLLAGQRVDFVDRLDLVAEQREAPGAVLVMRREDFDRVAAHPERAAEEIVVVAAVLQFDELGQQLGRG